MWQPHPCDACCGSEGCDDDDGEDAVVDQDTAGVTESRLVLSINFVASCNAKAIASQQIEMERPVAATRRNQRLLQGISRRVDDCLSKDQPSYHNDDEVSSTALVRALEWFKDSSFTVSVIAPSDSIPLRQVPSLASALTKLREVQFALLCSDDERTVGSSQNILRLLRAIKRSENPSCGIRQINNYALQLHGLTILSELYLMVPSRGESASVQFLFFRVASAEEVLIPPPEHCQIKAPQSASYLRSDSEDRMRPRASPDKRIERRISPLGMDALDRDQALLRRADRARQRTLP
ncbi:hypothetical protein FI667_g4766, partial [Globisporangium splendens]